MFRLSPQQKHIWQLHPVLDGSPYRTTARIEIEGPLDSTRLQAALDSVIEAHEIFRTGFEIPPGMSVPLQVIAGQVKASIAQSGEPGIPGQSRPPLLGAVLTTLSASSHRLDLAFSAMVADAATLNLFVSQLAEAYAGSLEPDEEALQYADLSEWLNETLEDEENHAEIEHWYREIIAAPIVVRLPFERNPGDMTGFEPRRVQAVIGAGTAARLDALAAKYGSDPGALYLAVFQALIRRLSGQNEFVMGLGCSGRTYTELEEAPGPFNRTLPLPAFLEPGQTLAEALEGLQGRIRDAFDRQEYFSWDIAAAAGGDSPLPFFALNFDFNDPLAAQAAGAIRFKLLQVHAVSDRFNLKLSCTPVEGLMQLDFHYDAVLFDAAPIERMAGHYTRLLEGLAEDPDHPLEAYPLVSPAEQARILGFNPPAEYELPETTVVDLITAQAAKSPEAVAVIDRGSTLSYAGLEARAGRIASRLRALGAGPGQFIGLFTDNSHDTIAGILGILKAGAAYLPLDSAYPHERLAFMLSDSEAPIVLTQTKWAQTASELAPGAAFVILDGGEEEEETAVADLESPQGDDYAYLIYTSGSTGKPKGVPVTHRNLMFSTMARHVYYPEPVGRYMLLSSFSFDSSVAGIFWTLTQGGAIILAESGMARDTDYVVNLIHDAQATHILTFPSLYDVFLDLDTSKLQSLQTVLMAGEVFAPSLVERHRAILPHARYYNEYGPTEGSVWASVFNLDDLAHDIVPIGVPIPGAQLYVFNERRQLAPLGVAGELYIGGPGVTGGYLKRPEQTAARFVPNPFGEGTLYKTGDLVRWLPDGNLEFLGRVDDQVKIRGYRVELAEIEAVLIQAPQVREVAVVMREDSPGDRRLVAYVVAAPSPALPEELRAHLSQTLPDYMLPSTFVALDAMPRMPNGKVDRKSLPAPDRARRDTSTAYAAPHGAVEEMLAGIWSEVLGLDKVGRDDNFFELGGHSILVTQLVSRIREALPVELPLRTMFDKPTIAGLSSVLLDGENREAVERTAELTLQVARMSEEELDAFAD